MKTITELEEGKTETRTIIPLQSYLFGKTFKDNFYAAFSASFDNSERSYINRALNIDTVLKTKYMDNYLLKLNWSGDKSRIYTHASYSSTEKKITAYGAAWSYTKLIETGRIDGAVRAGYDYFYHWTNSAKDYAGINMHIQRSRFDLSVDFERMLVRTADRFQTVSPADTIWSRGTNAGAILSAKMGFMIFKPLGLALETGYEFSDYQFGSLLFYSTNDRQLAYGGLSADNSYRRFIYSASVRAGYDDGGKERNGSDVEGKLFWKSAIGLGWDFGVIVLTINANLFSNAVYQSQVAGLKIAVK